MVNVLILNGEYIIQHQCKDLQLILDTFWQDFNQSLKHHDIAFQSSWFVWLLDIHFNLILERYDMSSRPSKFDFWIFTSTRVWNDVRFPADLQNLTFGNNFNQTLTFEFLLLIHSGVPATSQQGHHQSKRPEHSTCPKWEIQWTCQVVSLSAESRMWSSWGTSTNWSLDLVVTGGRANPDSSYKKGCATSPRKFPQGLFYVLEIIR